MDISEDGARLAVDQPHSLPNEFSLNIYNGVIVTRRCRVVWRSSDQVGVNYTEPTGTAVLPS